MVVAFLRGNCENLDSVSTWIQLSFEYSFKGMVLEECSKLPEMLLASSALEEYLERVRDSQSLGINLHRIEGNIS